MIASSIKTLTLLHTIRIFVELVLFDLSVHKLVPQLMTFEGRNFDIISGITAPFIFYFGFIKHRFGRKILLAWNFICLAIINEYYCKCRVINSFTISKVCV